MKDTNGKDIKIYKVVDGEVVSTDVVRETEKRFYVERTPQFGYCSYLYKGHACVTPQEAVQEEYNKAVSWHGILTDRLNSATKRLDTAKRLVEKHGTETT